MARPERNNVDYFPFLCKEGKAMFYIEQKYGNDGYATWVKILRQLAVTNYHFLNLNDKVEFMYLASKCKISEQVLENIISDLCEMGEFNSKLWSENRVVWSEKFYENIKDAYLTRKNKCIDLSGLHTHLLSLGVIKPSNGGKNKGNNTHTILDNTISDKTRLESINTLAEQSSAYKYLVKTKENIWEFIKTEKPQFIEPYADYWNLFADKYGLAKVQKVTNSRKKKFKTRLAEEKFNFLKITKKLTEASDFVLTQKWMTFDWVIFSESNYVKILEGNYDKTAINNEKAININKTPEPEYTNLDGR